MDYIKKLLQALLDTLVPPGTIIMYGGSQVPDGYILIQNVKVYQDEFPRLYPVLSACPELEKGNDSGRAWVKMVNPDGRVPQFTTTGSLVWKLLEAALPNITGYHRSVINAGSDDGSTGVFYFDSEQSSRAAITDTGTTGLTRFNAQRGSGIFQDASTVQPPALNVLACIRI